MKSLNTIQTLMKIARVIATIVLVFSIIGMVGCAVGGVALYLTKDMDIGAIELEEGVTVGDITLDEYTPTIEAVYFSVIAAFIACVIEVILSDRARRYFKFAVKEGTPFTYDGAKRLKNLGILYIVLAVVASIVEAVVYFVFTATFGDVINLSEVTYGSAIGTGVMMLIFAVVFKHGAEMYYVKDKAIPAPPSQTVNAVPQSYNAGNFYSPYNNIRR